MALSHPIYADCAQLGFQFACEFVATVRCARANQDAPHKAQKNYIFTFACIASRFPEGLVKFIHGKGKHEVLVGSNCPIILQSSIIAQLDHLKRDPATEELYLYKMALRVSASTKKVS